MSDQVDVKEAVRGDALKPQSPPSGVGEPAAATGSTTASLEAGGEENLTLKDKLKQLEAQLRDKEDEVKPTSVGADDMSDPPPLP